jgi:hypothetical protein
MTESATVLEIQRLCVEGALVGQWERVGPLNAMTADEATECVAALRAEQPGAAFRSVPFGTGPGARAGDVTPHGSIVTSPTSSFTLGGAPIWVTDEQADNAALFGWRRNGTTGHDLVTGNGLVQIERVVPA